MANLYGTRDRLPSRYLSPMLNTMLPVSLIILTHWVKTSMTASIYPSMRFSSPTPHQPYSRCWKYGGDVITRSTELSGNSLNIWALSPHCTVFRNGNRRLVLPFKTAW